MASVYNVLKNRDVFGQERRAFHTNFEDVQNCWATDCTIPADAV